jgi:serine protease
MRPIGILAGLAFALFATLAVSAENNPVLKQPNFETESHRFIVKMKASSTSKIQSVSAQSDAVSAKSAMQSLAVRAKVNVTASRLITKDMQVMQWEPQVAGESSDAVMERLRADPDVEYVEIDHRRYAQAVPNDPLFSGQWFLQNAQPAASNATMAWDTTTGSNGVIVAVLDTGIRYGHTDLRDTTNSLNRLLPGYDFVSPDGSNSFITAGDGDGRDSDPSDPGDFATTDQANASPFSCTPSNSSWHGTRVSGMIAALSNNGSGVAGMMWSGWILPVRVLGKCGGYDSDILAAMLWAAGIHVDGVPDNQFPAKIENLSLGSTGQCTASYQSVVTQVAAKGVLVVVSAGNEGGPVGAPANCNGAMAIAGIRHAGTKVGFSSLGTQVAISAPGGNCVNASGTCLFSLDTTSNSGTQTPATSNFTDMTNTNLGTSFSAPIVSGIAGLMLSVNGNLKSSQLMARLKEGAVPFPVSSDATVPTCQIPSSATGLQTSECNCTTSTCGAGMANAANSVNAALRPIAAVALSTGTVTPGSTITLNGSGSAAACNHTVTTYAWSTVTGSSGGIANANSSTATVTAPAAGSMYTVRLTVTDESGKQDTADVVVSSTGATSSAPTSAGTSACLTAVSYSAPATAADSASSSTTPPSAQPSSSGGGGGGGALDWFALLMFVSLVASRLYYRPAMRSAESSQDF